MKWQWEPVPYLHLDFTPLSLLVNGLMYTLALGVALGVLTLLIRLGKAFVAGWRG